VNWYIATIVVSRIDRSGSGFTVKHDTVEIHRFDKALQGDDAQQIRQLHPDTYEALAKDDQGNLLVYAEISTLRPALSGHDYRLIGDAIDIACGSMRPRDGWRALGVICPVCHAEPGHQCVDPDRPHFHIERIAACKSK
jgi:hypothetical protein